MNIERAIGIVRDPSNADPYTLRIAGGWLASKVVEYEEAGSRLASKVVEYEELLSKIQGDFLNLETALTDLVCHMYPQHKGKSWQDTLAALRPVYSKEGEE